MTYGDCPRESSGIVAGDRRFGTISAKSLDNSSRSKARSSASGAGWICCCETTMLLCPAIR